MVWITGLSGAGKTTLALALIRRLRPLGRAILVDGDQVRALFGDDLGHDEASRRIQIGRVQRLARWLADQGQTVVVAALYCHPDLLAWNRAHLPGYFEVYLNMPISFVSARDAKGIYAAGGAGRNIVGMDIPWHEPGAPDYVVEPRMREDPDVMAGKLLAGMSSLFHDRA